MSDITNEDRELVAKALSVFPGTMDMHMSTLKQIAEFGCYTNNVDPRAVECWKGCPFYGTWGTCDLLSITDSIKKNRLVKAYVRLREPRIIENKLKAILED